MADPVTLAGIGIGATAAGTGIGAIGSLFQGKAQSNMYNYQAGVAKVNATLAKQDANYATEAGEVETQQIGMRGRAQVGATRAGIGAGNIDTTGTCGCSESRYRQRLAITQENEAVTNANVAKRAYGFNVKAAQDTTQAGAYGVAAETSTEAGEIGAASTVIGGAGSVASKWSQFGQSFGTGSGSPTGKSGIDASVYAGG